MNPDPAPTPAFDLNSIPCLRDGRGPTDADLAALAEALAQIARRGQVHTTGNPFSHFIAIAALATKMWLDVQLEAQKTANTANPLVRETITRLEQAHKIVCAAIQEFGESQWISWGVAALLSTVDQSTQNVAPSYANFWGQQWSHTSTTPPSTPVFLDRHGLSSLN